MADLIDIKDMTPNLDLVAQLERALEQAKSGELRSMLWAKQWDNRSTANGWACDWRSSDKMLLSELVLLQHDIVVRIGMHEKTSALFNVIDN